MTKIGKLISKAFAWVKSLWTKLDSAVDKLLPIATGIVQKVKVAVESDTFSTIKAIVEFYTPDAVDLTIDTVVAAVQKIIPKLAVQLEIIESIAGIEDPVEQVAAVIEKLKSLTDEQNEKYWASFAQELLYVLADGKVTWGEAASLAEYHYQNYIKQ